MSRPAAPPSPVMAEVRRLQAEAEKKQRAEQRKGSEGRGAAKGGGEETHEAKGQVMQMLNRAIKDAADFKAFREALTKRSDLIRDEVNALRQGESRSQRRARERAERKAAQKTKARA